MQLDMNTQSHVLVTQFLNASRSKQPVLTGPEVGLR